MTEKEIETLLESFLIEAKQAGFHSWVKRINEAIALLREPCQEPTKLLEDLLAVIHRDGGHHTAKVGLEQSVQDARAKVNEWKPDGSQAQGSRGNKKSPQ